MSALARVRLCTWTAIAGLVLAAGCAARDAGAPVVHVLAVLPIERVVPEADAIGTERAPVPEDAGQAVTGQIYRVLAEESVFRFVPDLSVGDLTGRPAVRQATDLASRARALGKEAGADAVIYGRVSRFRERVGTQYGATSPAAVSFDLSLVRVADGETLWQGRFDKTQEALSTNLFQFWMFWRGGPRWFTARELAGLGVEKLIHEMRKKIR